MAQAFPVMAGSQEAVVMSTGREEDPLCDLSEKVVRCRPTFAATPLKPDVVV